jgi:TRAP transporter TAXI family solute receptor
MELVMEAMGWTGDSFSMVGNLPASEHSFALCQNRVEAIVYTVGHPNPSIRQAMMLCDSRIVEVAGPEIDALVARRPYLSPAVIPGGLYQANPDPVVTFGVTGTVLASADLDEDLAYEIVGHVFDNLDVYKRSHPAFKDLDARAMTKNGLSAPLHPGAERYFREHGLLNIPTASIAN